MQAVKAREAGLVDEVVAPEQLLGAAKAWLLARPTALQPWGCERLSHPRWRPAGPRCGPGLRGGQHLLQAKTFHNMPAPLCIQSRASTKVASCPIDKGLRIEQST